MRDLEFNIGQGFKPNSISLIKGAYQYYLTDKIKDSLRLLDRIDTFGTWPDGFLELESLNLLKLKDEAAAKELWQKSKSNETLPWFDSLKVNYYKEPAVYLAYILPGTGMMWEGNFKDGLISLGINSFLITWLIRSLQSKNYGLAFVTLFLEAPFYWGNITTTKAIINSRVYNLNEINREKWLNYATKILEIKINY